MVLDLDDLISLAGVAADVFDRSFFKKAGEWLEGKIKPGKKRAAEEQQRETGSEDQIK